MCMCVQKVLILLQIKEIEINVKEKNKLYPYLQLL